MANICILPNKAEDFRKALKDKDLNLADLLNMSTEKRTKTLSDYVGEDQAKAVNTLFEEKLVLKNRMQGLKNWASKVGQIGKYSEEGKAELNKTISDYRAAQQERIFSPEEHQAFLNDLADKKVGTHITQEQASKVFELSKKVQDTKETTDLSGASPEHIQARQDLNNYVKSVEAPSAGASIFKNLATIGRNNLILNPATPLKTAVSEVVNSTMEAIGRRIASLSTGGANPDLVKQANAEAWETFKKTGANTAAMESLDDVHALNRGENFNIEPESSNRAVGAVEKGVRKVAQISNKVAIDITHNVPFTKFYQKTFFDTANISSTSIAKSEGLSGVDMKERAAEIFKDAAKIKPETREGAIVRMRGQEQAARVTSTNDTIIGKLAVAGKNALNKAYPGLGDLIIPIAKIPATVIANGLDNAGGGIPFGIRDVFQGRTKMQSSDLETRLEGAAQFAEGTQHLIRIGGTLAVSALIASQFTKKDFRTDNYGNHFVKIGNTWINTEYISAISPALAGFLSIKQDQTKGTDALGSYLSTSTGVLSSGKNLPGDEVMQLFNTNVRKDAGDFFSSRGVPMFIQNLQKNRPINRLFFGASGVESQQDVNQDNKTKAAKAAATRKANAKKKK